MVSADDTMTNVWSFMGDSTHTQATKTVKTETVQKSP